MTPADHDLLPDDGWLPKCEILNFSPNFLVAPLVSTVLNVRGTGFSLSPTYLLCVISSGLTGLGSICLLETTFLFPTQTFPQNWLTIYHS